ncbi:MAG: glycosyltransferase family 4 protein [Nanoarchaeota archaeon]|nr:glycosyltransferase family 4 protein [Nanoarchaeota archaeon]
MKLKIAIVAPYDFNIMDGNTLRPLMQATGLQFHKEDVTLFCLKKNKNLGIKQKEINKGLFSFLPNSLRFKNSAFLFDLPFLKKIEGLERFDLIHAHNYYSSYILPKNLKFILDLHTFKTNEVKNSYAQKKGLIPRLIASSAFSYLIERIEHAAIKKAEKVIVAGQNIKDQFIKTFKIKNKDKISIVNNCLDMQRFRKNKYKNEFTIGIIGPFKHMNSELLEHSIVFSNHIKEKIILIGDIDENDKNKLTDKKNIICLGRLPDNEYRKLLSEVSVILLPYFCLRQGGGLRNKLIEPAACGTPVITTHGGVEGFDKSLLLIGNTYNELMVQINRLKDKSSRIIIGNRLRQEIKNNYDFRSVSNKLIEVYYS